MIHTRSPRERLMSSMPVCPKPEDQRDTREARVRTSIHPAPAGHKKRHSEAETSSPSHSEDTTSNETSTLHSTLHKSEPAPPYTQAREKQSPCRGKRNDSPSELETATRGKAPNIYNQNEGLGCSKKRETHPEGRSTLITTHWTSKWKRKLHNERKSPIS